MRCTVLLSLLSIGVLGCGDHGLPTPDMATGDMGVSDDLSAGIADMVIPNDAKVNVSFTQFAQDYATTLCAHYVTCGQLDAAQMAACVENNLRHTGWDQDVEIMKGRLEINELQCLDAVKNARCDSSDVGAWSSRCLQFLYSGHQANGAACVAGVECTSGYCQHAGSDGGMAEQVTGCAGSCTAPKPTGAACRSDSDCAADSYCDSFGTQQCVKSAALNEDCSTTSCQYGLLCPTFPAAMPPTCVTPTTQMALHGACDPFQGALTPTPECATGMYCQLQYTASAVTCTGAPTDCQTVPGSYCDTTAGVCKDPSGGKCEMKIASAADCDPHNDSLYSFVDSQCADGTVCLQVGTQTKTTCQAFGSANADCNDDSSCKIGLYCSAGKCTPWFNDGDVCDTSAHCPSETQQNVCIVDNSDAGTTTTCQVTRSVGGACTPGFQDSLCEPSDLPGSSLCAPNGSGGGTCAPKCF